MAIKKQTQVDRSSAEAQKSSSAVGRQEVRVEQAHPADALERVTDASLSAPRPSDVRALQRALGNRETRRILQARLTVTSAGDRYEREADRVAAQVVSWMDAPVTQRQEEEEEVMKKPLVQRQVDAAGGMDVGVDVEAAIQGARGGGQPLADSVRGPMEQAFGTDFGGVRVHTGGQADALNRSIQARSFTTGQDIFFRQGEYAPGSRGGQELIAHELTHVVQQNGQIVQRARLEPSSPTLRNRSLIQRSKGDPKKGIKEAEYATLSKGETIKYTKLAAGCMAVTAYFSGGGGVGYHFAMMKNNTAQWEEFVGQIGTKSLSKLQIDSDMVGEKQGWWVRYTVDDFLVPSDPVTTQGPMSYATLKETSTDMELYQAGWTFDKSNITKWFKTRFGVAPNLVTTQSPGPYTF